MAAFDEFIIHGLSLVNTIQRKLFDAPEGDFSSDLSYSDDRPVDPMYFMQNCGGKYKLTQGEGGGGGGGGEARRVVATLLLPAMVGCIYR